MAPVWHVVSEIANNENWREDPIAYKYQQNAPGWLRAYAGEVVDAFAPISVKGALEKPMKGSTIGTVGKFMGDRPAGMSAEDPEGFKKMQENQEKKKEQKGMRHIKTDENRRQP